MKSFFTRYQLLLPSFLTCMVSVAIESSAQEWAYKSKIDSIVKSKHYAQLGAGISISISKKGKSVYERQFGMANIKKKIPITNSTRFNIGSISKQFTAACIYQLEAESKLNRTDIIQKYIPELPTFAAPITINHLISHTSGLPDHFEVLGLQNKFKASRLTESGVIDFFKKSSNLSFKPGERFSYCNTGYMLLAMIVKRVSGMSVGEYAKSIFFVPLKMNSTLFVETEEEGLPDNTKSYTLKKNKFKEIKKPEHAALGATGVFCTLEDYIKWNEFILYGMRTIGSTPINQFMQTSFTLNDGSSVHYGGGLILKSYKGNRNIEHSGGWNEFLTQIRVLPDAGYLIQVATNSTSISPFEICDEISDVILNPIQNQNNLSNTNKQCPIPLSTFGGTYIDENNVIRKIKISLDSLLITNYSNTLRNIVSAKFITSIKNHDFLFQDIFGDTLQFEVDQNQEVKKLSWTGGHYFRFRRQYQKLVDSTSSLKSYCGNFESVEFKQKIKIKSHHGKLKMYPIFFKGYELDFFGRAYFQSKE